MKTIKVYTFTVKNKADGKRYFMELVGDPKTAKEFKDAFSDHEDYDLRTIKWLDNYEMVSNYEGISVTPVYDSHDNGFVEQEL